MNNGVHGQYVRADGKKFCIKHNLYFAHESGFLPLNSFGRNASATSGRDSQCTRCRRRYQADYRREKGVMSKLNPNLETADMHFKLYKTSKDMLRFLSLARGQSMTVVVNQLLKEVLEREVRKEQLKRSDHQYKSAII